jgi:tetratricopeptide (TPR) repeat protein
MESFQRPPEVPPAIAIVSLPVGLAQFHHLPRHVPVWLHRQEAVEKDGYDFTEGARVMEDLLQEAPGVPGAYLYRLFTRKWPLLLAINPILAAGRVAEAIPRLVEVLEVDPECPLTCFQLGFCFRATGELEKSGSFYRQALRMAPAAGWIHSNLGRTYQALEDRPKAIEAYWKALELMPSDAFVLEQLSALGEIFRLEQTKPGSEVPYVKRVDYEKKAEEILAKETDPKALTRVGWKLLEDGLVDHSRRSFQKAMDSGSAPSEAKLGLGRVHLEEGRLGEAERTLVEFLEEEPGSAPGHLALFKAYLAQGETDLAWEAIQTAARLEPERSETLRTLYLLFKEADRLEEGVDWFRSLAKDHPKSVAPPAMAAQGLLELDRFEEAKGILEEVLRISPGNEGILLLYSAELGKRGGTEEILRLLEPLREGLPFSLTINLVLAYERKGDRTLAKKTLSDFLARPGLPELEKERGSDLLKKLEGEA